MWAAYLTTFATVLLVELTDRTRIIALLLSARYRAPVALIAGMTIGYIPAIAIAIFGAGLVTRVVSQVVLRWSTALAFFVFGLYLLWSSEA